MTERDRDDGRTAPPTGLMESLRARDPADLALRMLGDLVHLQPVDVPELPVLTDALHELLSAPQPGECPEGLRPELKLYTEALAARTNAKLDNRLRLRAALWAEATLRKHRRNEHARLRAFNREVWGLSEPAADDHVDREFQVRRHA